MKEKLSVVIPSRKHANQIDFLKRATESVKNQTMANRFDITFRVGVDHECSLEPKHANTLGVICVESKSPGQAAALNAALSGVEEGYVAFLEDDDEWMPDFLKFASATVKYCDFVSSTQFEVNEAGELLRINDFPTPSGWFMPVSTLKVVGSFSEAHRFHLDNEWLGRLAEKKMSRIHLVESTAPIHERYVRQVRPWLHNLLKNSAGYCRLARHALPFPLVKRLIHSTSGMAMISTNEILQKVSQDEQQKLIKRFGRIPW